MSLIFTKLQEFNLGLQGLLSGNYKKNNSSILFWILLFIMYYLIPFHHSVNF